MKKPKIFYGYWVLICCFIFTMISIGCGLTSFSFFIKTLQTDLGWSRTEIMAAFTLLLIAIGIASPFAGRLIEEYGARTIISLGALIAGAGFVLLSRMSHLWHFYVGFVLIGFGFTATGPLASSYVVSHWFQRRRGMAVGIVSMGMGITSIVFPSLVAVFLIPQLGWSNAFLIIGAISCGVIIPLSLFVVRTKPADMGLCPDGHEIPEMNRASGENRMNKKPTLPESMSPKSAVMSSAFWLIGISLIFNHTHLGVLQSAFPHLMDIGFSAGVSASAISVYGVAATSGMFFFGWLCDKIKAKYAAAIGLGAIALAIAVFSAIGLRSPVALIWLYAVIMGFGVGSWMPTMSMLTSTTFGMASYGAVFGFLSVFQSLGGAVGPLIAGYVYDTTHDYFLAFIIIGTLVVLAIPLILLVKRPKSLSNDDFTLP